MAGKTKVTTPTDRDIVITRIFDAPRELVYRTATDPALIPRWWGPARLKTTVDRMDVRLGGTWRFVQRDANGTEYGFHGEYRDIIPSRRLVQTFEFEGMPGHEVVETTIFEDVKGKTRLTITDHFDSDEDRDGMLESGMEEGLTESHDRFEALLEELQKGKKQ